MRILHISSEDELYGSAKCLKELILEELKCGVEPVVLTPFKSEINRFCDQNGVVNYSVKYMGFLYFSHDFLSPVKYTLRKIQYNILKRRSFKEACAKINMTSVDLVHTNNAGYDIGYLLAREFNKKHVWHLREGGLKHFNFKPYYREVGKYMSEGADNFIAVSEFVKKEWIKLGIPGKKIKVLYDGVSENGVKSPIRSGKVENTRFIMCGSIMKAKGQMTVIQYFNHFPKNILRNVELYLFGSKEGKDYNDALSFVKKNNLEKVVFFKGYTDDIWEELSKYDFAINYSNAEAFGRVTVEYMMAGLPVIAVDTGANRELLGKYGIIIKKDDENQFASAVINAISRKAEYKQQTEEISQYAKCKFSAENNLKEIINYFEGIISAGDN